MWHRPPLPYLARVDDEDVKMNFMQGISWSSFWNVVFLSGLFYYLVVLFVCYRREIVHVLLRRDMQKGRDAYDTVTSKVAASEKYAPQDESQRQYNAVHDLLQDLKMMYKTLAKEQTSVSIVSQLRKLYSSYPILRNSAFRMAVNNQVLMEVEHTFKIILTDEELDAAWQ